MTLILVLSPPKMKKILVLHGPNLNALGMREPSIYGSTTLDELNLQLHNQVNSTEITLTCKQSNSETQLIEYIYQAHAEAVSYLLFNPAAFTHQSIALRDALLAVAIPFIEIHLSNIHAREVFRKQSYFSDIAQGVITGFGIQSYFLALQLIINRLSTIES